MKESSSSLKYGSIDGGMYTFMNVLDVVADLGIKSIQGVKRKVIL